MALPNDSLYQHIIKSDYIEYWRKRMVNVSPSFMELFDNLIAYDYSQRPSISEIRESAWNTQSKSLKMSKMKIKFKKINSVF